MSDPHPARTPEKEDKRTFLQKLAEYIHPGPDSTAELIETLAEAEDNNVIGPESRFMLEGVLRMADLSAGDVMVPATRMDVVNIDAPYDELLHGVIDTAHSRFPVYEGERENIIGILMAKDLLKLQRAPELNIRALLRPASFVPESKGLNDLLRDFRGNRNHLAVVIDEFGRVAGLITIEDVLEQIVGDIADEYDFDEDEDNIIRQDDAHWRVKADTEIEDFNTEMGTDFSDDDCDTVGGLVLKAAGQLPKRNERIQIGEWQFTVLRADSRRLHSLLVERSLIEAPDQTA